MMAPITSYLILTYLVVLRSSGLPEPDPLHPLQAVLLVRPALALAVGETVILMTPPLYPY